MLEPERSPERVTRNALDRRAWLSRSAPWLLALVVYAVAAIAITWPVAADPTGEVFGAPGDATGNITLLRYRNDLGVGPLSNAVTHEENAPFGITLPGATSLPQVAIEGPMQLVGKITGSEVLAFNLAILSGVILSAFACFLLCWYITRNPWAAGVAGVAYGFNPWILARAGGHVHFTHLWSLCLVVLGLIVVRDGRGGRAWALLAAAMVFGLYTNTYFALFIGVIIAAFLIADVGGALIQRTGTWRAALRRGALASGIYVAALIPQAIVSVTQRSTIDGLLVGTRSAEDSYNYGSRWWEWFVPSESHPFFRRWTESFRLSHLHLSNPGETNIYLGLSVVALAIVGVTTALIARRRGGGPGWPAWFAGCLVVAGVVASLPSHVTVLGQDVPMPAALLHHVVEPWRVYARLFAVVAIGVAVLAAIGVAWLLSRVPARAWPVAAAVLAAVVAYDLASAHTHFSAANTPIYDLLKKQPGDAPRVEYPLVPPTSGRHLAYIFYTAGSGKHALMNGGRPGTAEAAIQGRLGDPSRRFVAPALAALGVRWAIVHGDAYGGQPVPVPGAGFELVGRRTTDALYRVTAKPALAIAVPSDSFDVVEPAPGGHSTQWMLAKKGSITVLNPRNRPVPLTLRFTVGSFAHPRDFTIAAGGRVLARGRAGSRPKPVVVSVVAPPGVSGIGVSTPSPPTSIAKVLKLPDARSVSLQLSDIQVTRADARE